MRTSPSSAVIHPEPEAEEMGAVAFLYNHCWTITCTHHVSDVEFDLHVLLQEIALHLATAMRSLVALLGPISISALVFLGRARSS